MHMCENLISQDQNWFCKGWDRVCPADGISSSAPQTPHVSQVSWGTLGFCVSVSHALFRHCIVFLLDTPIYSFLGQKDKDGGCLTVKLIISNGHPVCIRKRILSSKFLLLIRLKDPAIFMLVTGSCEQVHLSLHLSP